MSKKRIVAKRVTITLRAGFKLFLLMIGILSLRFCLEGNG